MQTITVKEIRGPLGKGEKKFFAVVDENGAQFTTFDAKIKEVTPGSRLEIEVTVTGKYVNIADGWKVLEKGKTASTGDTGVAPGVQDVKPPFRDSPEQRASIEGQVSAKLIAELYIAGKLDMAKPEEARLVDQLLLWLENKLGASLPPLIFLTSPKQRQEVPGGSRLGAPPSTTEKAATSAEPSASGEKPVLTGKTTPAQDFATWVTSHGKKFTPSWACNSLGVKALTEIADLEAARRTLMQLTGWSD